jgi:AcrR family transcriptional regulator
MATTQTEPRVPLSRERILSAALELVDEHGIHSLSMRKLGQALGFEAMSLYNHVANKDDLIDGMLDLVLAEGEPPSPDGDWDAAIRASAISVYQALRRHPWAGNLVMTPAHIRPARLRYMDSLLGRLRGSGFSADATYHAYHALDAHIFGFALWQASHSYPQATVADVRAFLDRMIPVAEYPHLNEHGRQHLDDDSVHEVSAFEFSLDLILDGLKKLHDAP